MHPTINTQNDNRENGLTLLELIITMAIVAVVIAFAGPNLGDNRIKKEFKNYYDTVRQKIADTRNTALGGGTTGRLLVSKDEDEYTLTIFRADTPTTVCDASGSWTQVNSFVLTLNTRFEITGTGVDNNTCFYRDNTASGGTFNVVQKDGLSNYGTSSITIVTATGYIDATFSTGQ